MVRHCSKCQQHPELSAIRAPHHQEHIALCIYEVTHQSTGTSLSLSPKNRCYCSSLFDPFFEKIAYRGKRRFSKLPHFIRVVFSVPTKE